MRVWGVYWAPEGRKVATVLATTSQAAKRKCPRPWRKYLGEVYVQEEVHDTLPLGSDT